MNETTLNRCEESQHPVLSMLADMEEMFCETVLLGGPLDGKTVKVCAASLIRTDFMLTFNDEEDGVFRMFQYEVILGEQAEFKGYV